MKGQEKEGLLAVFDFPFVVSVFWFAHDEEA